MQPADRPADRPPAWPVARQLWPGRPPDRPPPDRRTVRRPARPARPTVRPAAGPSGYPAAGPTARPPERPPQSPACLSGCPPARPPARPAHRPADRPTARPMAARPGPRPRTCSTREGNARQALLPVVTCPPPHTISSAGPKPRTQKTGSPTTARAPPYSREFSPQANPEFGRSRPNWSTSDCSRLLCSILSLSIRRRAPRRETSLPPRGVPKGLALAHHTLELLRDAVRGLRGMGRELPHALAELPVVRLALEVQPRRRQGGARSGRRAGGRPSDIRNASRSSTHTHTHTRKQTSGSRALGPPSSSEPAVGEKEEGGTLRRGGRGGGGKRMRERKTEDYDGGGHVEAGFGRDHELTRGCRTNARHAIPKIATHDRGKLGSCPNLPGHLPQRCRKVAVGDKSRPQCDHFWPNCQMLAKFGSMLAKIGRNWPSLGGTRPMACDIPAPLHWPAPIPVPCVSLAR